MNTTSLTHTVAETIRSLDEYRPTPLQSLPGVARLVDVSQVHVKLENERPLGNFKFLGGMIAGMRALAHAAGDRAAPAMRLICASDGNHGLAVAAAARRCGVPVIVFLPSSVSRARAERITAMGGDIRWIQGTYDDAVTAAEIAAAHGEGILVADTTADSNNTIVADVMAGYKVIAEELIDQFNDAGIQPTHLFVQAGVGGLAAALADVCLPALRGPCRLVVVEPEQAACVAAGLRAGHPVRIEGDLATCAEMLSCGVASAPALEALRRHDACALPVPENQLQLAPEVLQNMGGPQTSPSGAAGLAGLMHAATNADLRARHGIDHDSKVVLLITEGSVT